jgi:hypothetical protein
MTNEELKFTSIIRKPIFINNEYVLNVGEFVRGLYAYTHISGIVVKTNKSSVVIKKYNQNYNEFTSTNELINLTKKRIYQVGLINSEKLID